MKTFINRLISSSLFILLVIFTVFIAPTPFFSLIAIILIGVALYEFIGGILFETGSPPIKTISRYGGGNSLPGWI